MKSVEELRFPADYRYSEEHGWARSEGEKVRVGITDYAQDQLGEIVYLQLPQVGDAFKKDEVFGSVESVKTLSELFLPVGGEIIAVNPVLRDTPQLVNKSPYDKGWMVEVKPMNPGEVDRLLTKETYVEMLKKVTE